MKEVWQEFFMFKLLTVGPQKKYFFPYHIALSENFTLLATF